MRLHYNRGVELAGQRDFEGAEKEFEAALELAPRSLPVLLSLGLVYEALGRSEDAISQYQTIVRLNRASEEARQAIRRMAQIGDSPESARLIRALYEQARARLGLGDLVGARQAVEAILALVPENTGGLHLQGLLLSFMGQKEEAIASFKKALEVDPRYIPSRYEVGLLYEEAGRVEEAIQEYQAVMSLAPLSAEATGAGRRLDQLGPTPEVARGIRDELSRGETALKEGRLEEAKKSVEKALQQLPQHVGALYGLGLIHLRSGRLVEGESALVRALQIDPSFARSRFLLGALYELQGRPEDALKEYQQAQRIPDPVIAREAARRANTMVEFLNERTFAETARGLEKPRLARSRFSEGLSAMQRGEHEKAIEEFRKAIEIDPSNPYFYFNLGLAYVNQKLLVLAVGSFQKAIELKPDHFLSQFWLGLAYQLSGDAGLAAGDHVGAMGEYKNARYQLEKSLSTSTEEWVKDEAKKRMEGINQLLDKIQEATGHLIVADALRRARDTQGAIRTLEAAAKILPQDPFILLSIGSIHEDAGNSQEAIEAYQKAAEGNPFHLAPYINLGLLFQKLGRLDEAEKAYQKAVEVAPNRPEPRNRLGGFYFAQRRFEDAEAQYKKSIEIDPKNAEAQLFLAQVYEQERRRGEAMKQYDIALGLLDSQSAEASFIQDKKRLLRLFSGTWSHTFFSYDNNANASASNPQESISNSFNLSVSYIPFRTPSLARWLPIPLTLSMDFNSGSTSLLRSKGYFNTDSVGLSLQTNFLKNYGLFSGYRFSYSQSNRGPSAIGHSGSLSLSRKGKLPSSAGLSASFSRLESLINSANNRFTRSFGMNIGQRLGRYGSVSLDYGFSTTMTIRQDQTSTSHSVSVSYSKSIKNTSISAGVDLGLFSFATPRVVPKSGQRGLEIVTSTETNQTSTLRFGFSRGLKNGLNFSMNYSLLINQSNLDIQRPPVALDEQVLQQIRPTDNYQKHSVSLGVSKSF